MIIITLSNYFIIKLNFELLMRIELTTSSLPRKCSTPELQQQRPFSKVPVKNISKR